MGGFDFNTFLNTFDFDALMAFFNQGAYMGLLQNKVVWGVGAILIALIAVPKTREAGATIITWGAVGGFYFVCGVAVKNSVISKPGPFVLLMTMAFGAIGYLVWTKLIRS